MFADICDKIAASGYGVHALEIVRAGKVVLHEAFDEDKAYPVYSAAKSVTSAAFSLCCDDGLVSPQTMLSDLIDDDYKDDLPDGFDKLPFERFLTMTAGEYPFRPQGDDWLKYIFSLGTDYSDTSFHYSNIPAYLVGAACENAVGRSLMSYLEKRIFEPLDIPAPTYTTCPKGHFYGATGMEMTVHQLALLGQLYLQKGEWNGRQLISQQAVSLAVQPRVFTGSDYYGYFFRVADDCFSMVGKWGQRCIVFPQKQLVAAYLSHCPDDSQQLSELVHGCITQENNL